LDHSSSYCDWQNDRFGLMQSITPGPDIVSKATYNMMIVSLNAGLRRIGTVLLGAGVGGLNYMESVNAMSEGYFRFLDEYQ